MSSYYPEYHDARPRAPSDEETGLPLPIAPDLDMDNLAARDLNVHHAVYPKLHPILQTLGGKALRVARLQVLPQWLHNGNSQTAYHNIFGNGIHIPETIEEQAGMVALSVAGYIPREVVDTSQGEPLVRNIRNDERAFLTQTQEPRGIDDTRIADFRKRVMPEESHTHAKDVLMEIIQEDALQRYKTLYYGEAQVREFVRFFVLNQDISIFNRRLMKKFIRNGEPAVGLTLLGQASAAAALKATIQGRSLEEVYRECQGKGLLNPHANPKPASYLMNALGTQHGRVALMPRFRDGLTAAYEQVA